jgi:hypothetical protein
VFRQPPTLTGLVANADFFHTPKPSHRLFQFSDAYLQFGNGWFGIVTQDSRQAP